MKLVFKRENIFQRDLTVNSVDRLDKGKNEFKKESYDSKVLAISSAEKWQSMQQNLT